MPVLAIALVWGGLILLLQISGGSFLGSYSRADVLGSVTNAAKDTWLLREGVIGLVDKTGRAYSSNLYGNAYPDVIDFQISDNSIFASTDRGLFVSVDEGRRFDAVIFPDGDKNTSVSALRFFKDADQSYAVAALFSDDGSRVFLTRDDFKTSFEIFRDGNSAVASLGLMDDRIYLGMGDGRLLRLSLRDSSLAPLAVFDSGIRHFLIDGDRLYIGPRKGGFYVSEDGGVVFRRRTFLDPYRGANTIRALAGDSSRPGFVYALTDYGFIRSTNGGETWQEFRSFPEEASELSVLAFRDGTLFAASSERIFKTQDEGKSWQVFDPRLARKISSISVFHDTIVVGTKD